MKLQKMAAEEVYIDFLYQKKINPATASYNNWNQYQCFKRIVYELPKKSKAYIDISSALPIHQSTRLSS